MFKKMMAVLMLTALSSILLLGCTTDYEAIQNKVVQAFAKEVEIKSYSFEGTAAIQWNGSLGQPTNPLSSGLMSMLAQSEISWKGAANKEPAQMEATLKLTPSGSSTSVDIPVLIKDSKIYFHVPALSKDGEFFFMDLKTEGTATGNLQQAAGSLTEAFGMIAGGSQPKWFEESKDAVGLPDGKNGTKITLNITDKNAKDFNAALQAKLPEIADKLLAGGLLDAKTAEAWKKADGGQKIAFKAPGKMEFVIDDQGFIREQTVDLNVSAAGDGGAETTGSIKLHQVYSGINQAPSFTMQVPSDAKPFEDILKFLKK